jgi:hypothetical protein
VALTSGASTVLTLTFKVTAVSPSEASPTITLAHRFMIVGKQNADGAHALFASLPDL